jgi:HEAT repeat protein
MMNPKTSLHKIHARRLATLSLAAASMALALAAAPAHADAQAREMLNRLVQSTSGANDPAASTFVQGRSMIDDQKWEKAASTFNRFVLQYPTDKNIDAALYWLAYAHSKQGNLPAASATLDRLLQNYTRSTWADDAKALRFEVLSKLNPGSVADVPEEGTDDLKIIALKALCENDKGSCSARVNDVLRSGGASPRLKEAAIILLGRYGGAEAVPALIQMSRNEPNDKLRMRAIRALGSTNDDRALEVLRELAMSATYEDESPTDSAVHALVEHESPRAVAIIGDVAINGKNLKARTHIIELVSSRRRGDDVVDQLFRIYDTVPELQVKKYVLAGLANRKDPRAMVRLSEVARTAGDVQLRSQAIRSIANRGEGPTLDLLLPIYDSERDNDLKNALLQAFGQYQDQRAYQKLMQVVQNNAEPIERRKTAITMLSRSKDPVVQQFLVNMLK